MVILVLATQLLHSTAPPPTCTTKIDTTAVRAGDDYQCTPLPSPNTLATCRAACCASSRCVSFSFNEPWSLNVSYMGCVSGENCCCLKSSVPPLEPNKWPMKITTGVASRPPVPFSCTSNLDCMLNGECETKTSTCTCDTGWRDDDCGELALVPMATIAGAYEHPVKDIKTDCSISCGPSSWGGLPLKGPNGKYHLFASQFVNNCTLAGWNPGSQVVRAVSDLPEGPYVYAETVFPTFHHNPTVRRLTPEQSGTGAEMYLMLMIGDDTAPPAESGAKCAYDAGKDPHHLEGYISLASAPTLLGPWTVLSHAVLPPGDTNDWDAMVTNPAPFIFPNGTALLYYRGTKWPIDGLERIGVAKSTHGWRGPYGRVGEGKPLWGNGSDSDDRRAYVEDPSVWQDTKRGNFHMLSHGHWDENGYYACAEHAEGPWRFRIKHSYTNVIAMEDGTSTTMVQRERPQLWFNETTGEPALLFTGVAPPGSKFYGYTYTLAQRVQQK